MSVILDFQNQIAVASQKLETGLETSNKNLILDSINTFKKCRTFDKDVTGKKLIRAYTALCLVDPENAMKYLDKATVIDPNDVCVINNISYLQHKQQGDFEGAINGYEKCISIDPTFETAFLGIIDIFDTLCLTKLKSEYLAKGLKHNPKSAELLNIHGLDMMKGQDIQLQAAKEAFTKALMLPSTPATQAKILLNQGHASSVCGDVQVALKYYVDCINTNKDEHLAYGNVLLNLQYIDKVDNPFFTTLGPKAFGVSVPSEVDTVPSVIAKYQTALMKQLYGHLNPKVPIIEWDEDEQPLRVGFISADYVSHAVSCFTDALLANLAKKVQVFCYANVVLDAGTRNTIPCEVFRCIKDVNPDVVASFIRDTDKINILIDLSGHTSGNRMDVLARRPAPTILSYCGYPNDTGFDFVQRVSDEYTERHNSWSNPKPRDLKRVFLCYTPPTPYLDLPYKSYQHYNPKQLITLGCFGKLPKINSTLIRLWREILLRYPRTRLMLKSKYFSDPTTLQEWKQRFGGCAKRVIFHQGTKGSEEHMRLFNILDLHLDTFPYSGTTITTESLFMNVPVLTMALKDDAHVSRVSASIVSTIGMEKELVATSFKDYVAKVGNLIDKLPELHVRDKLLKSPFMDGKDLGNKFYEMLLKTNT